MACPRCRSVIVTKDGNTQLGGQRFRCSQCGRRFTRRSSSAFTGRAFSGRHYCLAVRWYVRYRLSYAEVSEWLAERGVLVDQSTIYRWVQRFLLLFGEVARKYRAPIGSDWRVDEIYARIRGRWLLHLSSHRRPRPDRGCVRVADTRRGCRARVLRAGDRFQRDDAASGHHRQSRHLPASPRCGRTRCPPSHWALSYERHRARPRVSKRTAAADSWSQVCCFAAIFMCGHALMRNIRHRFYRIVKSVPQRLVLAWTWNRLAEGH
jgi:transposase-like protein